VLAGGPARDAAATHSQPELENLRRQPDWLTGLLTARRRALSVRPCPLCAVREAQPLRCRARHHGTRVWVADDLIRSCGGCWRGVISWCGSAGGRRTRSTRRCTATCSAHRSATRRPPGQSVARTARVAGPRAAHGRELPPASRSHRRGARCDRPRDRRAGAHRRADPPADDGYVFADRNQRCTESLRWRVGNDPRTLFPCGNANGADASTQSSTSSRRKSLVVLYGDQDGLDLNFDTVKFLIDRRRANRKDLEH